MTQTTKTPHMPEAETKVKITKHEFYFEVALYQRVAKADLEGDIFSGELTGFNPDKQYQTTFTVQTSGLAYRGRAGTFEGLAIQMERARERFWDSSLEDVRAVVLTCKQSGWHSLVFFLEDKDSVTKIGQTPSLADIRFAEVANKYEKQLSKEDLHNFRRAIGVHAHGIGIGSFVYLRRIFENLIWATFNANEKELGTDKSTFGKLRMDEKVDALKGLLPSQLVEMKGIYGILSTGLHELTEEDCLRYFPPVRLAVELILDQRIEERKKVEKDTAIKKALQRVTQELSKKD